MNTTGQDVGHWVQRLYVVVNGELSHGYQTAQALHALTEFALNDPDAFRKWHNEGNFIVCLQAKDIRHLVNLRAGMDAAVDEDGTPIHRTYPFHEPDLGDQMTSFAITPHPDVQGMLNDLPLVGRREPKKSHKPWAHLFT